MSCSDWSNHGRDRPRIKEISQKLPLLPLTSGRAARDGVHHGPRVRGGPGRGRGGRGGRRPAACSSPSSTGVTPRSAWSPRSWRAGELPGGLPAVAVRGVERATSGTAVPGTGRALWVEVEPWPRARATPRARSWPASTGRCWRTSCSAAARAGSPSACGDVTEPGRIADMAGYSPDLTLAQKVQVLETLDVEPPGCASSSAGPARSWPTSPCASGSRPTSKRAWRRPSASSCCAASSKSIRKELGQMGDGDADELPTTTGRRWRAATCPKPSARRSSARSTSSSG